MHRRRGAFGRGHTLPLGAAIQRSTEQDEMYSGVVDTMSNGVVALGRPSGMDRRAHHGHGTPMRSGSGM